MTGQTLAGALTKATGNRLDWYNIGGLAIQRTRDSLWGLWSHYSWRELAIRGGIAATTAFCAYVAANSNQGEGYSRLARGVAGATFGFFTSHAAAVYPTIQRRNEIKKESVALYNLLGTKLDGLEKQFTPIEQHAYVQELIRAIKSAAESALHLDLPVTKKGDAVTNLVTINRLIRSINERVELFSTALKDKDQALIPELFATENAFWKQDIQTIKEALLAKEPLVEAENNETTKKTM